MPKSWSQSTPTSKMALGRTAGRGFLWLLFATGLGKISALVGQIALGWLLFAEDWGLYALTLGITAFVQIFRDGGVSQVIIQSGKERYKEISGPAFWMAATFNFIAAAILFVAAPMAASLYSQPALKPMLWIVAAAIVCGTPSTILRAKLSLNLNFFTLGWLAACSSIIRWGTAIGLAIAGLGPMSFIWAMFTATVFETISSWAVTREQPWASRPLFFTAWPEILKKSVWVIIASVASGFSANGVYFVLGLLIGIAFVGQYSFGSHFAAQLGVILAFNMRSVFFPTLTRMVDDPLRFSVSVEKGVSVLLLILSGPALFLAAVAQPLELILWGGKWANSVAVIQIISIVLPIRMMITVPYSALLAKGRFSTQAVFLVLDAVVSIGATVVGGILFGENLGALAATIGISQALFAFLASSWVLRNVGCNLRRTIFSSMWSWVIAISVASGVWLLDQNYFGHITPLERLILAGSIYSVAFGILVRLLLENSLRQLLSVIPEKIGRIVRVTMLLS